MPHPDFSIVYRTAVIAGDHTGRKVQFAPVPTTLQAVLTGCFPTIDDPACPRASFRFAFTPATEQPPTFLTEGLGQPAVFQHPPPMPIFQNHDLVLDREYGGQLVQEIQPSIGNVMVQLSNP